MTSDLSPNTQAILLLTAPLATGKASHAEAPLTPKEYNQLALQLRDAQHQPADLLGHDMDEVLKDSRPTLDALRVRRLLDRGFLLSQAVERWRSRAIWVISRADLAYPRRMKARLKESAPPVLYGCGDVEILGTGGLAVVGSRHVDDALVAYAEEIGRVTAAARQTVVSGGARGIDQAAMRGALGGPGKVVGVLADSLERSAVNREHRDALLARGLVLISPYDPGAPFNVGHAMQRNKLIYALADAALVVNSDLDKGGTWAGATEQLEKFHFVRVYVRSTGEIGNGLQALRTKGALPWPNPSDANELMATLHGAPAVKPMPVQDDLPFAPPSAAEPLDRSDVHIPPVHEVVVEQTTSPDAEASEPARELFAKVREVLLRLLTRPMSESEVGAALQLNSAQSKEWLERLVAEGVVERGGGSGYVVNSNASVEPATAIARTGNTRT
jgi:DNA processing protein